MWRNVLVRRLLSLSQSNQSQHPSTKLGFLINSKSHGILSSSSAATTATSVALSSLVRRYGRCYWEPSKARLSMLVVATSGTGSVLGSGCAIDIAGLSWTCTGTMMVAACANSLNQVFEISNDAKMKRTRLRPLPSGRISIPHALTWASSVGVAGTALLACKANMLTAGLAASNLILYAFAYTPLKQIHPINTWVGAIVGAIAPLLGYRMLPLADASGQRTASVALRNCLYLIPLGYLAYDWGVTSGWFCLESSLDTIAITASAFSFYRDRTTQKARKMFHASLLYLPVFMSGILFHRLTENQQSFAEEDLEKIVELSSSPETVAKESESIYRKNKLINSSVGRQSRPPVAYASFAPFPFLPAPSYPAS